MRALLFALLLGIASQASAAARVAVLVVDFPSSQPARAETMDWTRDDLTRVDAFYAEQSYGQFILTSEVFGIFRVDVPANGTRAMVAVAAWDAAVSNGVDMAVYGQRGFCHCVYVSPSTTSVAAGYGDGSGVWIASSAQSTSSPGFQITAHELGHHLFNLNHAQGLACSDGPLEGACAVWAYGDTLDIMGQGYGAFNAITKSALGWLTPQSLTSNGEYRLNAYESGSGVLALLVTGGTKRNPLTYVIEYRQPIGIDAYQPWANPANVFNGVLVHLAWNGGSQLLRMNSDDPSFNGVTFNSPALLLNQAYCDNKLAISVVSLTSAAAVVRLGRCR